jgi:hypothetical protein
MASAVRASVRRGAVEISNAATATDEIFVAGGKLYVTGCAGCHGELAKPFREDYDHFAPVPQLPFFAYPIFETRTLLGRATRNTNVRDVRLSTVLFRPAAPGSFGLCSPNPEFAAGCVRRYPGKMTGGDAQNYAKAIANNHGLLLHTPTELSEHLLYSARRWNIP